MYKLEKMLKVLTTMKKDRSQTKSLTLTTGCGFKPQ